MKRWYRRVWRTASTLTPTPGARPYSWAKALDETGLRQPWSRVRKHPWDSEYDHAYRFFNDAVDGPACHAGYALDFHRIQKYLRANPSQRPSQRADTSAHQIPERLEEQISLLPSAVAWTESPVGS